MTKLLIGLIGLCSLFSSAQASDDGFSIQNPWIREAPPTVKVLAGFMILHNHTDQTLTINAISSPDFERVELHKTEIVDGVAKMIQQESITLPANQSFTFKPGGHHLMLINPKQPLSTKDKPTVILSYNKSEQSVSFAIKKATGNGHHNHHHHH